MAQRRFEERSIRKLTQTGGGSISLTIPIEHIRTLGWRDKQKVIVKKSGKKLIIEDWKA